jgi:hypothetical protein
LLRCWQRAQGVSEEELRGHAKIARAKLKEVGRRTQAED